jgi:hypothetical protein
MHEHFLVQCILAATRLVGRLGDRGNPWYRKHRKWLDREDGLRFWSHDARSHREGAGGIQHGRAFRMAHAALGSFDIGLLFGNDPFGNTTSYGGTSTNV